LARGNSKLGDGFVSFDLPPVQTCPGRSRNCSSVVRVGRHGQGSRRCYAIRLAACRPSLRRRLQRNLDATGDLSAFAARVEREARLRGAAALRLHVSGDLFSPAYALAWLGVMRRMSEVQFLLYTRSWRVPTILPALEQMALLPNVALWFSCDASTGTPARVPEGVRLAWMALHQAEAEPWACLDDIARCHLVFLDQPLRRLGLASFGGVTVCPQERQDGLTCSSCRACLRPQ
jgi:hypothetical protein